MRMLYSKSLTMGVFPLYARDTTSSKTLKTPEKRHPKTLQDFLILILGFLLWFGNILYYLSEQSMVERGDMFDYIWTAKDRQQTIHIYAQPNHLVCQKDDFHLRQGSCAKTSTFNFFHQLHAIIWVSQLN